MKNPFLRRMPAGTSTRILLLLPLIFASMAADALSQQSSPLRITCPPNQTNWHCGVASTAVVTYPTPTTTGSCPTNAVVICAPPSGATFILGTTTVTCRATNSCRESAVCTFTVTVARDTIPPVIQCPTNRIVWLCGTSVPDARVFWPSPTATDNADTNITVTCSPPSGSLFPPGTTTVTCTATDDCTNRTTCTFTVTVIRDLTPPVITCPASINIVACSPSGAVVNYPTPTATDNADPNVAITCSPASGSLFPIGTTTVTCTATDDCTNRTTCTFLVRVTRDTTPPVFQLCPSNIVVLACDRSGIVVNYPTPTATDNLDPSPTISCSPRSGDLFPVGTTTVTCTATDGCTNRNTCSFTITVNADTTPPVIQCPSNIVLWTCSTSAITHYAVTATDDYDTNVTIACTPPVGTPLPVGDTTVNCAARDDCGNTSQCSFQVRVIRDTTPPAIECPSNMVFNCLCPGNTIVLDFFKPTVTDDHDPNPTVVCVPPSLVSSPGVHLVTCTATDNCGNSNRCSFTVTFNYDTTAPALTCPTNMFVWTCGTSAMVNYPVTATDTCAASVDIVCTPPSGSMFPLGTSVVVCTATDNCTNRSTCTFTVTVRPPLIYRGLCHSSLGLATLNLDNNGQLGVSDLGASGDDGVRIDLGESQGLTFSYKNAPELTSGDLEVQILGRNTAGQEIQVNRIMQHYEGGKLSVTPSSASYEVKLLLRGEIVYRRPGTSGRAPVQFCTPVENEHCPQQVFVSGCFRFVAIECTSETDSGPVLADTMVITPEVAGPPVTALTAVQMLGRNLPGFTLEGEGLMMFGSAEQPSLPHRALGQARLVAEDGMLTMADLGASGEDGVRIEMEKSAGLKWRMKNPTGTPEGDMDFEVFGRTAAGTEIPLRRISHLYRNGRHSVTPGAGPYEVKLLRQGQVVFQQSGRTGSVDIPDCEIVGHEHCVGEEFADLNPLLPYCLEVLTVECPWETPNGPVLADTLVLTPEDAPPPFTAVSAVQILGRNVRDLPSLTLLTERVLPLGGGALQLACPPSLTIQTCSTNPVPVSFSSPAVTGGACTLPATVVCVPPSGSLFPAGVTTVQCTATNTCGERVVCEFKVKVIDTLEYQLEREPNNVLASATDIGQAGFFHGYIGRISQGDVDFYRFTAPPKSLAWITVDTGGVAWLGANSRDSVLTLYDGAGAVIESDDNDGSGNGADSVLESGDASAIAGAALAGGTYYLSVAAPAGGIIAPYRVYLTVTTNVFPAEVESNNTAIAATALVPAGQNQGVRDGSLNPFGDEDWYTVSIGGPSLLHISVDGDPERDGVGTDVVVDLFRMDGVSILFSADSSAGGGAVAEGFVYRLSIPGTYYVRVRSAGTAAGTGSYRVMVAHCPLPPTPGLGIIHRGASLTLSWPTAHEPCLLRSSSDLRTWTFLDLTPTAVGDELRVELPSTEPHQFFQLVPDGGWSNDTYHCCTGFNQCSGPVDLLTICVGGFKVRCFETASGSVLCTPSP